MQSWTIKVFFVECVWLGTVVVMVAVCWLTLWVASVGGQLSPTLSVFKHIIQCIVKVNQPMIHNTINASQDASSLFLVTCARAAKVKEPMFQNNINVSYDPSCELPIYTLSSC